LLSSKKYFENAIVTTLLLPVDPRSADLSLVYGKLRSGLPYEETRRYLKKVVDFKKDFVNL
jgi:hypothetical protein